jgi:hypothetical protein
MKRNTILLLVILFFTACKSGKQNDEKSNVRVTPVLPFIKGQIAQIDTSLYSIKKIEILDSLHADTIDVSRNDFRTLAKDFLNIPDISSKEYKEQYEESQTYDQDLQLVSLLTLPKAPSSADIQKQELIITPDAEGGKIRTIYIDREWTNKDSSVTKKMIWQVDEYFQVLTLKQLPGQPEISHILKVTWKDFTKPE